MNLLTFGLGHHKLITAAALGKAELNSCVSLTFTKSLGIIRPLTFTIIPSLASKMEETKTEHVHLSISEL